MFEKCEKIEKKKKKKSDKKKLKNDQFHLYILPIFNQS